MSCYYQTNAGPAAPYPVLDGDIAARVCVVGGGFAGLYSALGLVERGVSDVVLLEAEEIGYGASGRNGGFVFAGYSLGERSLLNALGPARARHWYGRTVEAVNLIRTRIARYAINCDVVDAGVLWANWFTDPQILLNRQKLLAESYGSTWQWLERSELQAQLKSDRYSAALYERNALHLQPLKLARGWARVLRAAGVRVYEQSPAQQLNRTGQSWQVKTAAGSVNAEHVVIAGGGYLGDWAPRLRRALLPIATYVMSTEPLGARLSDSVNTNAAVYDSRFAFDYYRALPDSRLLWGGRISVRDRPAHEVARLLKQDLLKVYPQLGEVHIEHAWSGLMSYARHEMPQVGQLEPGLWYAQAFGGHGLAPTCVAGETLAAAIAEQDKAYLELARFGLSPCFGTLGLAAAQINYSWLQARDAWKAQREAQP